MKNRQVLLGHLALFTAYSIFGINIITTKDLTAGHLLSPMAIFCLRALGAGTIFWIISLLRPAEKVAPHDYPKILLASLLGFFLTQMTFLTASPIITPMGWSVVCSVTPIFTMFIAAIALKEPITGKKVSGVMLSFIGIVFLILTSKTSSSGPEASSIWGYVLALLNGLGFALYLGIFRPLISRYSVVTFMKWIFLFAFLVSLPFSAGEILAFDFTAVSASFALELGYLIVFATFVAYFLIPVGQKCIRPTLVSMYSYLQPLFAITISIIIGMDTLTVPKILAAIAVFGGVLLVNFSKAAPAPQLLQNTVSESSTRS